MSDPYYPYDLDWVWFACDRNNHIGAFVTAGIAPIPVAFLDLSAPELEDLDEMTSDLPKVSGSHLLVSMYKDPSSFLDLAERGIFAYDWSDIHKVDAQSANAYQLIAAPTSPILLASLPDKLRALTSVVKFAANDFSEETFLKVHEYFSCRRGRY